MENKVTNSENEKSVIDVEKKDTEYIELENSAVDVSSKQSVQEVEEEIQWGSCELIQKEEDILEESNTLSVVPVKKKKKSKIVFRIITEILFWSFCIALLTSSLIFAFSKNPSKSYFGYRFYSVLTDSMAPDPKGENLPGGFYKGDMIIIKMCKPSDIKVGDIITYNPNPRDTSSKTFLTHRVIAVDGDTSEINKMYFKTKGDNNSSEDLPVAAHMLIGKKVKSIRNLGLFLQFIRANLVASLIAIFCLFGSFVMFKWYFSEPIETTSAETDNKKIKYSEKEKLGE